MRYRQRHQQNNNLEMTTALQHIGDYQSASKGH